MIWSTQKHPLTPIAIAIALMLCAGCGDSLRTPVGGRITRADGSPVVGATVTARSDATGKWARGVTDADGAFELGGAKAEDGVEPGEYYVTIIEDRGEMGQLPATIPARYAKRTASGIALTVTAGESQEFNLQLDPT
jgi:hypothetical protein